MAVSLLAAAGSAARADTYDLTADITSFRSWIPAGNASLNAMVGSTALIDSGVIAGTYQGSTFYWSNLVRFPTSTNTTSIDFGYDPAIFPARGLNGFSVNAGTAVSVARHVPFNLATLSFTNGQYYYRAEIGVHFAATDEQTGAVNEYDDVVEVTSNSSIPVYNPITRQYVYDPYAEADFFTLSAHPEFGSVRVFDVFAQPAGNPGNSGTITFSAEIGSLDPLGFTNPIGGAFIDSSSTAGLNDPHASPVPEPAAAGLFVSALALLMAARRIRPFGKGPAVA